MAVVRHECWQRRSLSLRGGGRYNSLRIVLLSCAGTTEGNQDAVNWNEHPFMRGNSESILEPRRAYHKECYTSPHGQSVGESEVKDVESSRQL